MIKKGGTKEAFDKEKLKTGILRACEKRPVSEEEIEEVVDGIEARLRKLGTEIESRKIGELVMRKLLRLDKVAYVRFAAVYRKFQDVEEFVNELKHDEYNQFKLSNPPNKEESREH